MQLNQAVSLQMKAGTPTNDSRYFSRGVRLVSLASYATHEHRQIAETMQESLGLQVAGTMAKPLPILKRLYKQWSKQLLQI